VSQQNWAPIFDAARVSLSFEHHYHVFKQTFAIRNNMTVGSSNSSDGVTYLGDGAWGLLTAGGEELSWYNERIESFMHVFVCQYNQLRGVVTANAILPSGQVFAAIEKKVF
jgi:hypothetical protein